MAGKKKPFLCIFCFNFSKKSHHGDDEVEHVNKRSGEGGGDPNVDKKAVAFIKSFRELLRLSLEKESR